MRKRLEHLNEVWVCWWRDLGVVRLVGASLVVYGLAIAARPEAGPAGAGAARLGLSAYWFAGALVLWGLPALVLRLSSDWYFVFMPPLYGYLLLALLWVLDDPRQPVTAIAVNLVILLAFNKLNATVAAGDHNGRH